MKCWAGSDTMCKKYKKDPSLCNEFCPEYVILDILYKQSNLPIRYQFPQPLSVEPIDEIVYDEISKIISGDILDWVSKGNSLFLWGEHKGNGKTSLACALANRYIRASAFKTDYKPVVYFLKSAKFLEDMRRQMNSPEPEFPHILHIIESVPFLIIDDIGAEKPSEWVRERLLSIIDERYSNGLSIIYTSNCSLVQLSENLQDRIVDRIRSVRSLQFKGSSNRGYKNA